MQWWLSLLLPEHQLQLFATDEVFQALSFTTPRRPDRASRGSASGTNPIPTFEMNVCRGVIVDNSGGLVEITQVKGKTLNALGFSRRGKRYLFPEEALYTAQRALLEVVAPDPVLAAATSSAPAGDGEGGSGAEIPTRTLTGPELLQWLLKESSHTALPRRDRVWRDIKGFLSPHNVGVSRQFEEELGMSNTYRCSFLAFAAVYADLRTAGYIVLRTERPGNPPLEASEVSTESQPHLLDVEPVVTFPQLLESSFAHSLTSLSTFLRGKLNSARAQSSHPANFSVVDSHQERTDHVLSDEQSSTQAKNSASETKLGEDSKSDGSLSDSCTKNEPHYDDLPTLSVWHPTSSFKLSAPPQPELVVGISTCGFSVEMSRIWADLLKRYKTSGLRLAIVNESSLDVVYVEEPPGPPPVIPKLV